MSKEEGTLVRMTHDVWPYGCRGDVIRLSEDELKELKEKSKSRKINGLPYEQVSEKDLKQSEDKQPKPKK